MKKEASSQIKRLLKSFFSYMKQSTISKLVHEKQRLRGWWLCRLTRSSGFTFPFHLQFVSLDDTFCFLRERYIHVHCRILQTLSNILLLSIWCRSTTKKSFLEQTSAILGDLYVLQITLCPLAPFFRDTHTSIFLD